MRKSVWDTRNYAHTFRLSRLHAYTTTRVLLQHTHTRRDESVGCFSSNPDHRFFPLQSQHGQCACANTHLSRACAVPYGRCFYQRLLGLAWNLGPTSHALLHVTPLRTSRRSCTSRPPQASLRHSNPHTWRPLGAKISFQEQTPQTVDAGLPKRLPQQNYPSFVGPVRILDKNIWHF